MIDNDGRFYEGLTSNIGFVERQQQQHDLYRIVSPRQEGILAGSVFSLLERGCLDAGISVVYRDVKVDEVINSNKSINKNNIILAAFLTSTSKLFVPIDNIIYNSKVYLLPCDLPILSRLREILDSKAETHLVTIL